jgi:hypothetical protein
MAHQNTPTKKKAPAPTTANGASNNGNERRKFSPKSTAIEAQYARVIAELRGGPKSTIQLRLAGVIMPAARVKELKDKKGYDIPTVARIDAYDAEGYLHPRIAVYELVGEPGMV